MATVFNQARAHTQTPLSLHESIELKQIDNLTTELTSDQVSERVSDWLLIKPRSLVMPDTIRPPN